MEMLKKFFRIIAKIVVIGLVLFALFMIGTFIAISWHGDSSYTCKYIKQDSLKHECYRKIAVSANNAKRCIDDESSSDLDKIKCIEDVAVKNKNIMACEVIKYENLKEMHERNKYGDFTSDEVQIKATKAWQDRCIYAVAVKNNDGTPCLRIRDQYWRELCQKDSDIYE